MTSLGAALARPPLTRIRLGNLAWWSTLFGLCVVLLTPLLVVDMPPLLDYPNHLARAFVLASLPDDTVLGRFYAPHWSIIPNLGLDLIAPPLMHLLPVHVVGRLLIAAALLLPVWGTVAYNTALGGRWWPFAVGLLAYNSCLLEGFLNFSISMGLALLLSAAWLRWRQDRAWRAFVAAACGAPILFACHLMGLVFFGLLIGGAELFQLYRTPRHALWRAILTRGFVLLVIFAVPVALYALSPLQDLGGDAQFMPPERKLMQLATIFVNYSWPLDMATAAIAITLPAACVASGWGRVPGPAACAAVMLLIAFLLAPFAWKGTYLLDTRIAVMLGFMLFAGFIPHDAATAWRSIVAAALALLFAVRMILLTATWANHRTDLADLRRVLLPVQPGQAVYVAEVSMQDRPGYWDAHWRALSDGTRLDEHLGALVLIERRAYWPFEFDIPSQQPIETREPYRALAGRVGHMPTWKDAATADVCGFDYVLLLEADAVDGLPAERFTLLARSGFAALYTITRCKPGY